jgi:hypothetical protein
MNQSILNIIVISHQIGDLVVISTVHPERPHPTRLKLTLHRHAINQDFIALLKLAMIVPSIVGPSAPLPRALIEFEYTNP